MKLFCFFDNSVNFGNHYLTGHQDNVESTLKKVCNTQHRLAPGVAESGANSIGLIM